MYVHGSTHMFTGTMLMRVSKNQQLKRTTSKQMNKIDRAYLYHGCRDHFSSKMSLERRESTDTFYHMDDLEEQYESEHN